MCCICSYSAEKKTIVTSIAPASIIYLLKFHNRYIRERCEICSPEPRYFLGSAACIVDFEHKFEYFDFEQGNICLGSVERTITL